MITERQRERENWPNRAIEYKPHARVPAAVTRSRFNRRKHKITRWSLFPFHMRFVKRNLPDRITDSRGDFVLPSPNFPPLSSRPESRFFIGQRSGVHGNEGGEGRITRSAVEKVTTVCMYDLCFGLTRESCYFEGSSVLKRVGIDMLFVKCKW